MSIAGYFGSGPADLRVKAGGLSKTMTEVVRERLRVEEEKALPSLVEKWYGSVGYIVVCDNSPDGLVRQVADHLNIGWQLQGGVSVSPIDDAKYPRGTLLYSQAMTLVWAG